jgi:hypothetical protein
MRKEGNIRKLREDELSSKIIHTDKIAEGM